MKCKIRGSLKLMTFTLLQDFNITDYENVVAMIGTEMVVLDENPSTLQEDVVKTLSFPAGTPISIAGMKVSFIESKELIPINDIPIVIKSQTRVEPVDAGISFMLLEDYDATLLCQPEHL